MTRLPTLLALLALAWAPASAQAPTPDERCAEAYAALDFPARDRAGCTRLALTLDAVIRDSLNALVPRTPARAVQPARGAGGGGAGAQSEAVPSLGIEPFAGGSLSAVGGKDGAGALATISLNPLVLAGDLDDVAAMAAKSRTLDLSIVLPVDDADRDGDGRVDYVGVRSRFNFLGARQGAATLDKLRADYAAAFNETIAASDDLSDRIEAALRESDNPTACAQAILSGVKRLAAARDGCAALVDADLVGFYTRLDAAAADVRREVDREYLGFDLRLDLGDPTLGTDPAADGLALVALLAGGRTLAEEAGLSSGLQGHLGVAYARRDSLATSRFMADFAGGFALTRVYGLQRIDIEAGVAGRVGFAGDDTGLDADGDHLLLSGSLNVPISATQSAAVRLAVPILGESVGPVLSVTGNWHLALPGLRPD